MILSNTKADDHSGTVPPNHRQVVDECTKHTIPDKKGSHGRPKFNFLFINGIPCSHTIEDLTAVDFKIHVMYGDAMCYSEAEAFADDAYRSHHFAGGNDGKQLNEELFKQLRVLWRVAHVPFSVLLDDMGLTQEQCSERFAIDYKKIQSWLAEDEAALPLPDVRLMMAESVGLLKLRKFI